MSTISSLGSGASSQALEQLRQRFKSSGGRPPEPSAEQKAQFESAAKDAGIDTEKLAGLSDQIQEAVQGALKKANGSDDPRKGIESAVNSVLKENGIDPEDLKAKLKTVGEKLGYGQGPGGFGGPGGPGGFGGPSRAAGPGGFGSSGGLSAANSKAQSYQSLFDAIGNKKDSDSDDSSSVLAYFKNLPTGSLVDADA